MYFAGSIFETIYMEWLDQARVLLAYRECSHQSNEFFCLCFFQSFVSTDRIAASYLRLISWYDACFLDT